MNEIAKAEKIAQAQYAKARKLKDTIAQYLDEELTVQALTTRDTEEFWRLIIAQSRVNGPSHPAPSGIHRWVSPEVRQLVFGDETLRLWARYRKKDLLCTRCLGVGCAECAGTGLAEKYRAEENS